MDWLAWEPFYRAIRRDFGYSAADDRATARRLAAQLADADGAMERLADRLADRSVVVAGAGPGLERDLAGVGDAAVVAADAAVPRVRDAGVAVAVAVTDLDGAPEQCAALSREGTPVAVHGHGDNAAAVDDHLPAFDTDLVVGTTQTRPEAPLVNHGGFTDGDRAAYLADACGAASLSLAGFDLRDTAVDAEKRWKLAWAERLLGHLEDRRGEPLFAGVA